MKKLLAVGQEALFTGWPAKGTDDDKKKELISQLVKADKSIKGGLVEYIKKGRGLLRDHKDGVSPLEGWKPSVPEGMSFEMDDEDFDELEKDGIQRSGDMAIVIVALGEGALGFEGTELGFPYETLTNTTFLKLAADSIIAFENKGRRGKRMNLAIMTSEETHNSIEELLEKNTYYGLMQERVHLIKQTVVPAFATLDGQLATDPANPFSLVRKPHGSGDIHASLLDSGLLKEWTSEGVKWVTFLSGINPVAFRCVPGMIQTSAANNYHYNTICIPRKTGAATPTICKLTNAEGKSVTTLVRPADFNKLLESASDFEDGDETDEDTGFSEFPGTIGSMIISCPEYYAVMNHIADKLPEYVEPVYTDDQRTALKEPVALQSDMADYPRLLPRTAKVGFTMTDPEMSYQPVTSKESAVASEFSVYKLNCELLKKCGADIEGPTTATFNGVEVEVHPRVIWTPTFAATFGELRSKVNGSLLKLTSNATLILEGDKCKIEDLKLNGALKIRGQWGQDIVVDGLNIVNQGFKLEPAADDEEYAPSKIKGFKFAAKNNIKILGKGKHQSFAKRISFSANQKDGTALAMQKALQLEMEENGEKEGSAAKVTPKSSGGGGLFACCFGPPKSAAYEVDLGS